MARPGGNLSLKVVLLGEGRVGKTSICLRYVNNSYTDKQVSTIQASFLTKKVNYGDVTANLAIWDTAGQERFHALGPIYYRDADGALVVYDITDPDSFKKVKMWVKELRKMVGDHIVICIAGNKVDLEKNRQVQHEEARSFAESVGATHFSTSAKLNKGIDEAFTHLTRKIAETRKARGAVNNRPKTKLTVVDDDQAKPKKSGCC